MNKFTTWLIFCHFILCSLLVVWFVMVWLMWIFFSKRSRQTGDPSQNRTRSHCHQWASWSLWEICGPAERLAEAFEGVYDIFINIYFIKSVIVTFSDGRNWAFSESVEPVFINFESAYVQSYTYIFFFSFMNLLIIFLTGSRRVFPGGRTGCPSPQEQHPSAHAQKGPTSSSARVFPIFVSIS